MKILIIIAAIFLLIGNTLQAQVTGNPKGGIIDSKGNIYMGGTKLGFITKDSLIKNAKGEKIAFLKSNGTLEDANGKSLGRWGKDGKTFYDEKGVVVLQIKDNADTETCDILDASGKKIGNVHDSYKGVACALHCFSYQMDPKTHRKQKNK